MPEKLALVPTLIGAEPFTLWFHHQRAPGDSSGSQGQDVDDRRGTFVRSWVFVTFPLPAATAPDDSDTYHRRALDLTNQAITAIRYVARDPAIQYVTEYDHYLIRLWHPDSADPTVLFSGAEGQWLGPFGVSPLATLSEDGLQLVHFFFNGLHRINPARLLLIDADYHRAVGDITRAAFDIGTALEIYIEVLFDWYSIANEAVRSIEYEDRSIYWQYDQGLEMATGHSLRERQDLYMALEYIHEIRNAIAHEWKAEFRIEKSRHLPRSPYLTLHQVRDGHVLKDEAEIKQLITDAYSIMSHVAGLFEYHYGPLT